MKRFALAGFTASILLFATPRAIAQAPPAPPEGPPPPPAPDASAAAAPAIPPQAAQPPVADPSKPLPPQMHPTAQYPQYQFHPPYGYSYPFGAAAWGPSGSLPNELAYSGGPIPHGYKLEERYNVPLLIAGPTLFALAYAASAIAAADKADEPPSIDGFTTEVAPWHTLYIPVVGPFAFSAYAPQGSAFIYVFEGLAQVTGVALFVGGILNPKTVLARKKANEAFQPTLHVGLRSMQLEMQF